MEADSREDDPTPMKPHSGRSTRWHCLSCNFCPAWPRQGSVVAGIEGDSLIVMKESEPPGICLYGINCPKQTEDLGERARGVASGMVFGRFQICRGRTAYRRPLRQESDTGLLRDEICKSRASEYGCPPMVTSCGFHDRRLPQNLGSRQKEQGHRTI